MRGGGGSPLVIDGCCRACDSDLLRKHRDKSGREAGQLHSVPRPARKPGKAGTTRCRLWGGLSRKAQQLLLLLVLAPGGPVWVPVALVWCLCLYLCLCACCACGSCLWLFLPRFLFLTLSIPVDLKFTLVPAATVFPSSLLHLSPSSQTQPFHFFAYRFSHHSHQPGSIPASNRTIGLDRWSWPSAPFSNLRLSDFVYSVSCLFFSSYSVQPGY
jgi:hypothetical protein